MAQEVLKTGKEILLRENVLYAIAAVNLAGTLFGFYYYVPQISRNPAHLWPLIVDSPLSTLFISISMILHVKGYEGRLVDHLAVIGNFKYGLWTAFVLIFYFQEFMQLRGTLMFSFLFLSHLLMSVQSLLVLGYTEFRWEPFIASAAFFLVNDLLDYGLGIHTTLPEVNGYASPVAAAAFSLTFSGVLLLYLFKKKRNVLGNL